MRARLCALTLASLLVSGAAFAQGTSQGTGQGRQMPGPMMGPMMGQGTGPGMMGQMGPGTMTMMPCYYASTGQGTGMMMCPMMGSGMTGSGMMGPMMGQGMMGPGMGMTGPGMMGSMSGAPGEAQLSKDDVKANVERWLAMQGNPRLKVGDVTEQSDTVTADIVTIDNSLVQRLAVDRRTGMMRPVQ